MPNDDLDKLHTHNKINQMTGRYLSSEDLGSLHRQ
jgi:hypothetical protein